MILADKILNLRKKNGWSQEELAEKLNVSRQSVSKWESAQSTPDLERLLQMSTIFGVSLDYLVKDEIEEASSEVYVENSSNERRVSMEEANIFLNFKEKTKGLFANAITLCIYSPIFLIILLGLSQDKRINLSENTASAIGIITILVLVAIAVFTFIRLSNESDEFKFLETENIETEYGVEGLVREKKREYKGIFNRNLSIGVVLCILSAIPILITTLMESPSGSLIMYGVAVLIFLVGCGVNLIVRACMMMNAYNMLLEEGDYTRDKKKANKFLSPIAGIYWLSIVGVYLAYGLITKDWSRSWIIFPVAGVLFGAIAIISEMVMKRKDSVR